MPHEPPPLRMAAATLRDVGAVSRAYLSVWSIPMALRWGRQPCPSGQEYAEDT